MRKPNNLREDKKIDGINITELAKPYRDLGFKVTVKKKEARRSPENFTYFQVEMKKNKVMKGVRVGEKGMIMIALVRLAEAFAMDGFKVTKEVKNEE